MATWISAHRVLIFGLMIVIGLASSTSAVSITNLTVYDITTTSATVNWLVVDLDSQNQTDLLRTYVRLKYQLNFDIDSSCLNVGTTTQVFNNIQPYTSYFACVFVVQVANADDECDDESPVVSQAETKCVSLTTEFSTWSVFNISALATAGGILIVVVFALAINVACPKKTLNDTVDVKKMRDWSKKKRTESVRDFLEAVEPDLDDDRMA